jgi:hypothetical protein
MSIQGYTKLFSSIVTSTIWGESNETRLTWITMLALADREGVVAGSIPGLAHLTHISIDKCEEAIGILLSPDRYSRSSEFEGRRIEKIEGGWRLLNHGKYRRLLSAEERRQYLAAKQREYRNRSRTSTMSTNVSDTDTVLTYTEADTEEDTKEREEKPSLEKNPPLNPLGSSEFQCFWEAYPRHEARKEALRVWVKKSLDGKLGEVLAGLETWKKRREPHYMPYAQGWLNKDSWKETPLGNGKEFKREEGRRKTKEAIARVLEASNSVD